MRTLFYVNPQPAIQPTLCTNLFAVQKQLGIIAENVYPFQPIVLIGYWHHTVCLPVCNAVYYGAQGRCRGRHFLFTYSLLLQGVSFNHNCCRIHPSATTHSEKQNRRAIRRRSRCMKISFVLSVIRLTRASHQSALLGAPRPAPSSPVVLYLQTSYENCLSVVQQLRTEQLSAKLYRYAITHTASNYQSQLTLFTRER